MRVHFVTLFGLKEELVHSNLSETIINRLSIYMHYLSKQDEGGKKLVSPYDIAQVCGVKAGLVRKDLARFGRFGIKGVGYYVTDLLQGIKSIFGLDRKLHVAIIGRHNIGLYFLSFKGFLNGNYEIVAVFDTKPEIAVRSLTSEITRSVDILHITCLKEVAKIRKIDIAIINTIPSEAQDVVSQVVKGGIRGILNFTPSYVKVPRGFIAKNIQFAAEQDSLVYLLKS
jgi:redox-sensing transcriptional repressor